MQGHSPQDDFDAVVEVDDLINWDFPGGVITHDPMVLGNPATGMVLGDPAATVVDVNSGSSTSLSSSARSSVSP
jgi:hypothetical protein